MRESEVGMGGVWMGEGRRCYRQSLQIRLLSQEAEQGDEDHLGLW